MFEPHEIVDPSDKFLEDKERAITLVAAAAALQRNRHRINGALWIMGGALFAVGTLVFAIGLGLWEGTEVGTEQSTFQQTRQNATQPSKVKAPSVGRSLAQLPQAQHPDLGVGTRTEKPKNDKFPARESVNDQFATGKSTGEPGGADIATSRQLPPVFDSARTNPGSEPDAETPEIEEERLRVTSASSIHNEPSDSADVIGMAQPGAQGIVASRKPDWVEIVDPSTGITGWIRSASLAPVIEDEASEQIALPQDHDVGVPDKKTSSTTVVPERRAKVKNYRSRPRYGRRPVRRLRSALRRFRR